MYTWISSSTYVYICSFNHFWYTVGPDQVPDESSGAVAQTEVIPKGVAGMYIHTTCVDHSTRGGKYCSAVAYMKWG